MSYDHAYIDHLDTLYERILSHDEKKYGPQEMELLVRDIEPFYRGDNITVTDLQGKAVPHESIF